MAPADISNISIIGMSFTVLNVILLVVLPRRFAPVPFFLIACYMTAGQQINFFGLHFYMIRILILFGMVRMIMRKEMALIQINLLDKLIIIWAIYTIIAYTLLYGTMESFINRLGFAFNALGLYFLFRSYLQDTEDIYLAFKLLIIVTIPLTVMMLLESINGKNLFSLFGGVPETSYYRGFLFRSRGPFASPITVGTFAATTMPLCLGLYYRNNAIGILGFITTTIMTIASNSIGPVTSYVFGVIGLMGWFFRRRIKTVIWSLIIATIVIQILMQSPVWYLSAKLSNFIGIGSHGWHRSYLISQSIKYFNEWWLIGSNYTAHWFGGDLVLPSDENMIDCTNQYISEGLKGGILKMALFISIIVVCFRNLKQAYIALEKQSLGLTILIWSIGVSLFVHVTSFFSVSYFDQITVFWYMLIASTSAFFKAAELIQDQKVV